MISIESLELFFEYNDFGYNGRYIPEKYKKFSNTNDFVYLDDIFQRLLLEKRTKVSESYSNETQKKIANKLTPDLSESFRIYVESYPRTKKPWWKIW